MLNKAALFNFYDKVDEALVLLNQITPMYEDKKVNNNILTRAHNLLGNIYIKKKNKNLAIDHFNKCLTYGDDNTNTYSKLASIYRQGGQIGKARQVLEIALQNTTPNDEIYTELGMILISENNFKEALFNLEKSFQMNPTNPRTNFGYAKVKVKLEETQDSLLYNIRIAKKNTEIVDQVLSLEIEILNKLGRYKEIIDKLETFMPIINTENLEPLYLIANAYERQKDYKNALATYHHIGEYKSLDPAIASKLELLTNIMGNVKLNQFLHLNQEEFVKLCQSILILIKYKNIEHIRSSSLYVEMVAIEILSSVSANNPRHYHYFSRSLSSISLDEIIKIHQAAQKLSCEKVSVHLLTSIPPKVLEYIQKNSIMIYYKEDFINTLQKALK